MALTTIYRNIWTSQKLINKNLNQRLWHTINTNIHIIKLNKKAPNLKNGCISFFTPRRNFFGVFKKPTKNQLKTKDNVPDEYILIYRNTMDRYILYAQLVTTTTTFFVILSSIVKYDSSKLSKDLSEWSSSFKAADSEIYVYIAAFSLFIVILQMLISRIPIRIYNLPQQKTYIFVFHGNYPLTQRKLTCKAGDVFPLPETGISPWRQGRYMIKDNQRLILLDQYFRRPADLYIMLGVQRDPDVDEK